MFTSSAEQLQITNSQAGHFNQIHDLGLVLTHHVKTREAELALDAIDEGSLVFVEHVRFDPRLVDAGLVDPAAPSQRTSNSLSGQPTEGQRIAENLRYNSLYFQELRRTEPGRYEELKDKAFRSIGVGLDYSSFFTPLYFGLIEKDCVFLPGDASSTQLTEADQRKAMLGGLFIGTEQLLDPKIKTTQLHRDLTTAATNWHDMGLYRDIATVYNVVNTEEQQYRNALGVGKDEVLRTQIVRGSGHVVGIGSVLQRSGIEYTVDYHQPTDGPIMGETFGPNRQSQAEHERRMGITIKRLFADVEIGSLGIDECTVLAEHGEVIGEFAGRSEDNLALVRQLAFQAKAQNERGAVTSYFGSRKLAKLANGLLIACNLE